MSRSIKSACVVDHTCLADKTAALTASMSTCRNPHTDDDCCNSAGASHSSLILGVGDGGEGGGVVVVVKGWWRW